MQQRRNDWRLVGGKEGGGVLGTDLCFIRRQEKKPFEQESQPAAPELVSSLVDPHGKVLGVNPPAPNQE